MRHRLVAHFPDLHTCRADTSTFGFFNLFLCVHISFYCTSALFVAQQRRLVAC